jgi:hypothetical protein
MIRFIVFLLIIALFAKPIFKLTYKLTKGVADFMKATDELESEYNSKINAERSFKNALKSEQNELKERQKKLNKYEQLNNKKEK